MFAISDTDTTAHLGNLGSYNLQFLEAPTLGILARLRALPKSFSPLMQGPCKVSVMTNLWGLGR